MSARTVRKIAILEPSALFVLIMAYIWSLRFTHHGVWIEIVGLMWLSHWVHRETAGGLGFHTGNLRRCLEEYAPMLVFLGLLMVASGNLAGTTRRIGVPEAALAWAAYLPWGLVQQYVLNGYFLNRFSTVLSSRSAPVISAVLFSGAHTPNWFLMTVTLLGGYCSARIYRSHNNLYFLAVAHASIGFLLYLVVPDSISHHLIVGPGWFSH
jgi:hypothetical protein